MDLSWILKFPTMTVFLAISPFISFMFLSASMVGAYMLMNIKSSSCVDPYIIV